MKLSASRITCIQRCQREYIFNYVEKRPQPKSKALLMGSAWHEVLEGKEPKLEELNQIDPDYPWIDALVAMGKGYDQGFPEHVNEVAREIKFEDDLRLGYIDAVVSDKDGWWVVECKTRSAEMDDNEAKMLPALIQNQMYHHAAPMISEDLWLDIGDYRGIKYVMTKKPAERRKKTETKEEFGARLTSDTQVIEIPKAVLTGNPEPAMVQALARASEAEAAYQGGIESVPCNTAACFRYNSPCPFFDLCHPGNIISGGNRRILAP